MGAPDLCVYAKNVVPWETQTGVRVYAKNVVPWEAQTGVLTLRM